MNEFKCPPLSRKLGDNYGIDSVLIYYQQETAKEGI